MNAAITVQDFCSRVQTLLVLLARYGNARRIHGPFLIALWNRVRRIEARVVIVLRQIEAGTIRRHLTRRSPSPGAAVARGPAPPDPFPRTPGWLIGMVQEIASSASHFRYMLAQPGVAELLQAAPQLRRALRPLCRILGVGLPVTPPPPEPTPEPQPEPPPAPRRPRRNGRRSSVAPVTKDAFAPFPPLLWPA